MLRNLVVFGAAAAAAAATLSVSTETNSNAKANTNARSNTIDKTNTNTNSDSDTDHRFHCRDIKVPVTVDTELKQFDYRPTESQIDVTNFFLDFTQHGSDWLQRITKSNSSHIQKTYSLAATICHPPTGPSSTLQILTHGVGFDRSYWDYIFPDSASPSSSASHNYSYVRRALLEAGHSTLTWDRPGIASSSSASYDPINEIQLDLEVAALEQLVRLATSPSQSSLFCSPHDQLHHRFTSTILVGHSFGSAMTYALTSRHPSLADAIILTGFSQAAAQSMSLFALGAAFVPISLTPFAAPSSYGPGYIAPAAPSLSIQTDFFAPADFDPALLAHIASPAPDGNNRGRSQPAALGELLTVADGAALPSDFDGAVLIVTGERDLPFCGGNCNFVPSSSSSSSSNKDEDSKDKDDKKTPKNLLELSEPMFPKAKSFQGTVIPGAGHGLNLGYSHTVAYDAMMEFVKSKV